MRPRRRERLSDAIAGRILYEDRDLVVVDKPAGMLTTHTRLEGRAAREAQLTVENCLNDYLRKGQARSRLRVWLVHRLDRETSGVMMFAKSEEVAEKFRADWASLTEKTYRARVEGLLEEESGTFESYLLEDADGYRVRSVAAPDARRASRNARTPKLAHRVAAAFHDRRHYSRRGEAQDRTEEPDTRPLFRGRASRDRRREVRR